MKTHKEVNFEHKGYHKDILDNGKHLGSIRMNKKDRENLGYYGRKKEWIEKGTKLSKGYKSTIVKKSQYYTTELHEICGKVI